MIAEINSIIANEMIAKVLITFNSICVHEWLHVIFFINILGYHST